MKSIRVIKRRRSQASANIGQFFAIASHSLHAFSFYLQKLGVGILAVFLGYSIIFSISVNGFFSSAKIPFLPLKLFLCGDRVGG